MVSIIPAMVSMGREDHKFKSAWAINQEPASETNK